MWAGCYGNSMPYARRHDPSNLIDFACVLDHEIEALQKKHPKGFMVRLHTLGDFPSLPYVNLWRHLLETYPALHCFGYTSNWYDAPDPEEAAIGRSILSLTNLYWRRFAIRFSLEAAVAQSAVVVDEADARENVVMCPAQTKASECCATCGLCWSHALRDKSIGFLRHGMKKRVAP